MKCASRMRGLDCRRRARRGRVDRIAPAARRWQAVFGYLAAVLLIGASALAIPALVSGLSARTAGVAAPPVRSGGAARRRAAWRDRCAAHRCWSARCPPPSRCWPRSASWWAAFAKPSSLWMDDRLQADLYLAPAVPAGRRPPSHAVARNRRPDLQTLPEVAAVDRFRAYEISYQGLPATLGGGEARIAGALRHRPFLSGRDPQDVFRQLSGSDAVIVSEPFANKHHVHAGRHADAAARRAARRSACSTFTTTTRTSAATSSWTAPRCSSICPIPRRRTSPCI